MKIVYKLILFLAIASLNLSCLMFQPGGGSTPRQTLPPTKTFPHLVCKGETLFGIAKYYGVKASTLQKINGIPNVRDVKVGVTIQVPGERRKTHIANNLDYVMNVRADFRPWKYILVHHSATDSGNMALFDKQHRQKGWRGVGYDFVIDNGTSGTRDGRIEVSHRWMDQMVGSHCKSPKNEMNKYGIGICLVGDFTKKGPSQAQLQSLVNLIRYLQLNFRIPGRRVFGHSDAPNAATECPGKSFPIRDLKRYVYK
jgi:N-acetylmuramoyl-L-alanine amidase